MVFTKEFSQCNNKLQSVIAQLSRLLTLAPTDILIRLVRSGSGPDNSSITPLSKRTNRPHSSFTKWVIFHLKVETDCLPHVTLSSAALNGLKK